MKLHARQFGDADDALVILPGLLGSSANWQSIAKRMARKRSVYALDMRNHGQSPWSETMSYTAMAQDVAGFISGLSHRRVDLLGHSMGGKAAMRLAFDDPQLIDSLIIADIAPVSYKHDFEDLIEAMLTLELTTLKSRSEADRALQDSVSSPAIRAFLLHNLHFDKNGKHYVWRPNLPVLLQNMHHITGFELSGNNVFDKPALFIYGELSDYVTANNRKIIQAHFGQASFTALGNAGHWLHAEQPQAFVSTCEAFLSHDY